MNIPNLKNARGLWLQYVSENRKCIWTQSGRVFNDMNNRCIVGGAVQKKQPTYVGCTTSINFKEFQYFANWHMAQIGFGLETYELDKDFIIPGNKLYSEDTCVLIPSALNTFFGDSRKIRGNYPQGVVWHPQRERFQAQIRIGEKYKYLGLFDTPELAFTAYKKAKEDEARRWYNRLLAGEFPVDPRVIERMRVWELPDA
jgi:hypothetical protein